MVQLVTVGRVADMRKLDRETLCDFRSPSRFDSRWTDVFAIVPWLSKTLDISSRHEALQTFL